MDNITRASFEKMDMWAKDKVKQKFLRNNFSDFCDNLKTDIINYLSPPLSFNDVDQLKKRARQDSESSVISELLLTLPRCDGPWWEYFEKVLEKKEYVMLLRHMRPWEDREHQGAAGSSYLPPPTPASRSKLPHRQWKRPYPSSTPLRKTSGLARGLKPICEGPNANMWRILADILCLDYDDIDKIKRKLDNSNEEIYQIFFDIYIEKFQEATVGNLVTGLFELGIAGEKIVNIMEDSGLIEPMEREGSEAGACNSSQGVVLPYDNETAGGASENSNAVHRLHEYSTPFSPHFSLPPNLSHGTGIAARSGGTPVVQRSESLHNFPLTPRDLEKSKALERCTSSPAMQEQITGHIVQSCESSESVSEHMNQQVNEPEEDETQLDSMQSLTDNSRQPTYQNPVEGSSVVEEKITNMMRETSLECDGEADIRTFSLEEYGPTDLGVCSSAGFTPRYAPADIQDSQPASEEVLLCQMPIPSQRPTNLSESGENRESSMSGNSTGIKQSIIIHNYGSAPIQIGASNRSKCLQMNAPETAGQQTEIKGFEISQQQFDFQPPAENLNSWDQQNGPPQDQQHCPPRDLPFFSTSQNQSEILPPRSQQNDPFQGLPVFSASQDVSGLNSFQPSYFNNQAHQTHVKQFIDSQEENQENDLVEDERDSSLAISQTPGGEDDLSIIRLHSGGTSETSTATQDPILLKSPVQESGIPTEKTHQGSSLDTNVRRDGASPTLQGPKPFEYEAKSDKRNVDGTATLSEHESPHEEREDCHSQQQPQQSTSPGLFTRIAYFIKNAYSHVE